MADRRAAGSHNGERDRRVRGVDHKPLRILAEDCGLHAVAEDLSGNAADRLQSGDMTTKDGLQILMDNETGPDQPGGAKYHREQPDDALDPWLAVQAARRAAGSNRRETKLQKKPFENNYLSGISLEILSGSDVAYVEVFAGPRSSEINFRLLRKSARTQVFGLSRDWGNALADALKFPHPRH
jgi:hypothetical protein